MALFMAQVAKKQFDSSTYSLVGVRNKKEAGSDEEKAGGSKRAVSGRAISTLPPRRGGAPTAVLSPARRSAAVRMGRGGIARPPEAEWSSGVAAFCGGCYNQDIFKDRKKRHDHVSVLLYKSVAAPRGRRRPSGARESQLFLGGVITKVFSKRSIWTSLPRR